MSPGKERVPPTVHQVWETKDKEIDSKNRRLSETDDFLTADKSYYSSKAKYVSRIRWPDLIAQIFIHTGCVYGFYLIFTEAQLLTALWAFATIYISAFGITAGAHRLWSHRAYKAKWPLRVLLIFLFTISGQRHVYAWALDHRVHHKYSETDADPHNAKRGFFFAHVGWLFTTPHPDVILKRKAVDMSDLEADPIVMWQKRYYIPLFVCLTIALPVGVPWYFWSESIWTSFWVNFNFRFCVTLNMAFFVNSIAHMWGQRPYDKYISPVENLAVSIVALGEGWHNFHHVFPWDYKTGELGNYTFNLTTGFIDAFACIGWAYDRKYVSPTMVRRRANRSGDGTHVWGYGDTDIPIEDLQELNLMDRKKHCGNRMSIEATKPAKKQDIKWAAVLWYIHLHVLGIYAIWLLFTSAKWMTVFFTAFITSVACLSVTMCHRLWAHKTFQAVGSLRFLLMLGHTLAGVGPIYDWVLYHRLHHKYYGTDKDPYNHSKGFLYSHYMSNCLCPTVSYEQARLDIDMRDMEHDLNVWVQKKFYWVLFGIFGLLLPLNAPLEYWDETMPLTILIAGILRFAITVNMSWLINSAMVIWCNEGNKIPRNISIFFFAKSSWPAYHYLMPWDWKSGEFGKYNAGCSTFFIKMWHELGLVNQMQTNDTQDVRDIVHQVVAKKLSMKDGLLELKKISDYNSKKENLLLCH
ncbi:uncharacterized protein LOC143345695 [Colletes latitarsis]|uniref:uncharacterized protein LOC143345695 n=1 Tax=Colletes latitarsis TaxID=2605962 RepID=UPI004036C25E